MVHYTELGLVNSRELFKKAGKGGYAVPAFNFNNLEQMQAIISACVETKSPVILQVSKGARKYANQTLLQYLARELLRMQKNLAMQFQLYCISIMAIRLKPASRASKWVFHR